MTKLNVDEAEKQFSDLLGRVVQDGETILIMRQGKPIAKLGPAIGDSAPKHLSSVKGWLEDDDPFFTAIDEIVEARFQHQPRSIRTPPTLHRGEKAS